MKCPKCKDPTLAISERKGIEIDYCPDCRGVWLDRGELDKILERSRESDGAHNVSSQDRFEKQERYENQDRMQGQYGKPYKRKKSLLEELFD